MKYWLIMFLLVLQSCYNKKEQEKLDENNNKSKIINTIFDDYFLKKFSHSEFDFDTVYVLKNEIMDRSYRDRDSLFTYILTDSLIKNTY